MTQYLYPRFEKKRTFILIGGILTFLFMGLVYAWSIIVLPLEKEDLNNGAF
jgi:hypothetical protein